jgi:hypothetical protein
MARGATLILLVGVLLSVTWAQSLDHLSDAEVVAAKP